MMKRLVILAGLLIGGSATAHDVIHMDHATPHTANDGHIMINHNGHIDHLHDGHLHHVHDGHVDEHVLKVSATNPMDERLVKQITEKNHAHSPQDTDHPRIQHGDHFDYIHKGRLHYIHNDHVDDHGKVQIIK